MCIFCGMYCMWIAWEHHVMETFSVLLALCGGNPPVTGGFPSQRASDTELWWLLWCTPEQTVELWVILDALTFMYLHCSGLKWTSNCAKPSAASVLSDIKVWFIDNGWSRLCARPFGEQHVFLFDIKVPRPPMLNVIDRACHWLIA